MKIEIIVFGVLIAAIAAGAIFIQVPSSQPNSLPVLGAAPEIAEGQWINSQPLKLSELRGKVVLVDFWTYSCINCIRTLPYLRSWHEKYADSGLVVVGVHTPEFEFEKDYGNVKAAVERYGLKYPVVQDNNYETWRAFGNRYWPRKYLIDREGNIRYDHIGEGAYEETEAAIQQLLGMNARVTNITSDVNFSGIGTPELYLGYLFARQPLGNPEGFQPGAVVNYRSANYTNPNTIYLLGLWKNEPDKVVSYGGSLFLVYRAKNVNIVAGGNSTIDVFVGGNPANGDDVKDGTGVIGSHRLYSIVKGDDYGARTLQIDAEPGFELYTFTFG